MKSCKTDKGRYKYSIYRQSNEICLETYLEEKETGQIFVGSYNEKTTYYLTLLLRDEGCLHNFEAKQQCIRGQNGGH